MEIQFLDAKNQELKGQIYFILENGKVLNGRYKSMVPFTCGSDVQDALIKIENFELHRLAIHLN